MTTPEQALLRVEGICAQAEGDLIANSKTPARILLELVLRLVRFGIDAAREDLKDRGL